MTKELTAVHPKFYRVGQTLFDKNGIKYKILDTCERAGKFYSTIKRVDINSVSFIEYDSHDYTGQGADPLPEFFRNKPKRRIRCQK